MKTFLLANPLSSPYYERMSIQALNWALKQELETPTIKLVLFILGNYCDEHGSCYPSEGKLADICGISDRQVRRCLKSLQDRGLISSSIRMAVGGGQTSNRYFLNMDTDVHPSMDTHVHPPLEAHVHPPRTPASTNTKEDTKDIYNSDFNAFWKLYPRKVGKYQSAMSYRKATKEIKPDKLLKITMSFAIANHQTEMRFVPHPQTWLNQKRYLDVDTRKTTINNLAG